MLDEDAQEIFAGIVSFFNFLKCKSVSKNVFITSIVNENGIALLDCFFVCSRGDLIPESLQNPFNSELSSLLYSSLCT